MTHIVWTLAVGCNCPPYLNLKYRPGRGGECGALYQIHCGSLAGLPALPARDPQTLTSEILRHLPNFAIS